uniref:Uncharacterized protein n=1 Tax=Trichogramma kaykai TaxID=54128 RepID=A0ABD2XND5_9HYME
MIRCFEAVRGDDTDHLVPECTGIADDVIHAYSIANMLLFHRHFGLYIRQEAYDLLENRCNALKEEVEDFERRHEVVNVREDVQKTIEVLTEKLSKIKDIVITEDISLYQLCQMNYSKGLYNR